MLRLLHRRLPFCRQPKICRRYRGNRQNASKPFSLQENPAKNTPSSGLDPVCRRAAHPALRRLGRVLLPTTITAASGMISSCDCPGQTMGQPYPTPSSASSKRSTALPLCPGTPGEDEAARAAADRIRARHQAILSLDLPADSADPLLGLRIRLNRRCDRDRVPCCDDPEVGIVVPGAGPHARGLRCAGCNAHRGWLKRDARGQRDVVLEIREREEAMAELTLWGRS
jgi:hypothetical protein